MAHSILIAQAVFIFVMIHISTWLYGMYIKEHPVDRTWLSVAIGTLLLSAGEGAVIFSALYYFGLFWLWPLVFVNLAMLIVGGLPMVITQELKRRQDTGNANKILEKINGER